MVELPQELIPASTVTEVTAVPPLDIATLPTLGVEVSGTVNVQELPPLGEERIYGPAQPDIIASPANNLIYAVPDSPPMRARVYEIIACNTTNATKTFNLTIGDLIEAKAIFWDESLTSKETKIFAVGIPLVAGEELHASQETAAAITLTINAQVTPA